MHKHEVIIRTATMTDAPAIASLAAELSASEGRITSTSENSVIEAAFQTQPYCRFLVAEAEGHIVGMMMFYAGYDLECAMKGLHLGDIIITKHYQKQGIGTKLMQYLATIAHTEGYGWLSWTVMKANAPARAFYRKILAVEIDVQFMAIGTKGLERLRIGKDRAGNLN